MSVGYPVLLRQIVIDSTNKSIRVKEDATTATVNIVEGTYYLREDSFGLALAAAIESIAGANTYSVTITYDIDFDNPTATVTIEIDSGTNTFQILWADGATTFDPELVGFAAANTADNTSPKVSTLSPSSCWVSNNLVRSLETVPSVTRALVRAVSGHAYGVQYNDEVRDRVWVQEFIHAQRWDESYITNDPCRAFSRFLSSCADGSHFEMHLPELLSGTELEGMIGSPDLVGKFHFPDEWYDADGAEIGQRLEGVALYNVSGRLWSYVAP